MPPNFTCSVCGLVSYNRNDIRDGYCGRCHDWTGPLEDSALENEHSVS